MKRTNVRNERLVALFLLGLLLFNYPFLAMFNTATPVLGVPKLYFYLFLAWAAVILVTALVIQRTESHPSEPGTEPPRSR